MYLEEISSMMHTFGDVKKPKEKSVQLMQTILHDQMNLVLFEAEKSAFLRESTEISHEDILFLMRKSKMKLKRLLEYLQVLDWKQAFSSDLKFQDVALYNSKLNGKWIEKCLNFMALIEDCDEFTSFMKDETIIDITSKKRKMRRSRMTDIMSPEEYNEFTVTSQASFYPFEKFKSWLLQDRFIACDLTDDALRIISFLARETIAEIVDMVLLMKMKKLGKYQYLHYECVTYSVRSDLNLNTSDTSEQTSETNVHETNYSTNTAASNLCSSYDRDSRNQIIVNKGENFKYFADGNCKEKTITPFKMNEHLNQATPQQMSLLPHIPSVRPQSSEDNMQEQAGRQQILDKLDSGSESDLSDKASSGTEPPIVDISDTSDHESFPSEIMACCDRRKSSKRKISPSSHSKKTAHEEPITDQSATDNQLQVAAVNEVEYITPIEPAEIVEAYNLLQKPSPMYLMFADNHVPRKTKLICLAESLSFDLR